MASAGAEGGSDVRPAHVRDLSVAGAYLVMPKPFSKGASILVKIGTAIGISPKLRNSGSSYRRTRDDGDVPQCESAVFAGLAGWMLGR